MEHMITKVTDILLSQPEEVLADKDNLIVISIVKGIDSFSKINKLAMMHRYKDYTEAKKEDLGMELTKVLFYTACLAHLCDVDVSIFNVESLTEFSESFPEDYQEDTILCSMQAMRKFMDIADEKYVTYEDDPDLSPDGVETIVMEQGIAGGVEDGEFEDPYEQAIAEILASVIILCEHFELDLETVMYNVITIKKP
jgi:NTP pyrophosphatase (non-canonical NTP hydrolase)